jgi:hypothetical protein
VRACVNVCVCVCKINIKNVWDIGFKIINKFHIIVKLSTFAETGRNAADEKKKKSSIYKDFTLVSAMMPTANYGMCDVALT